MPATLTYSPLPPQTHAERLRTNTCRHTRYAETHPVSPLKRLRDPRVASVSYRALAPGGETLRCGIKGDPSVLPKPIPNSKFLILHWTFTFSAKERDPETGLSYFGSRYYSSDLSVWLSVDPMAHKYPSLSPYVYCANNPVKLVDPNGEEISTHIDGEGNVIAVINDGDLGVYQHADGNELTENQIIELQKQKGTSAGGEKVGETYYWDEFVSPETGKTMSNYKIQVGKSFDPIIREMHKKSLEMNLIGIASESTGGGLFDIKKDYPNVGGLLLGKYVTSRSAGNFLAGYNASQGKYRGMGISFDTFQKLAGAVHIEESCGNRLSKSQMASIVLTGNYSCSRPSDFVPPTYGEVMYQRRMSFRGWYYGKQH